MDSNPHPGEILLLDNDTAFNDFALRIFEEQLSNNPVYAEFFGHLGRDRSQISTWSDIPCLPIEAFRHHRVMPHHLQAEMVFRSSGTTDSARSEHHVFSLVWYNQVSVKAFTSLYGSPSEWSFLALLPSYSERPDSSLIHMIRNFVEVSGHQDHGFYLNDYQRLRQDADSYADRRKVMIFGVTFALLEMAESCPGHLRNTVFMETGGMKGRGPELTRMEVHERLCKAFEVSRIHSEYGMTELLSQAYSAGNGLFVAPPWMRVSVRQVSDPLTNAGFEVTGGLNVIDLANIYSCPFIATGDLGRIHRSGQFEVLGRFDHVEARGCNLMVSQF